MLPKIFGARKLAPTPTPVEEARSSAALKIIHAGGRVEQYYMAVPAARIIDKYPSFMLARPDVFRTPWDAIVRREEILVPGQKYFVIPRRTVKKLRRQIKKPSGLNSSLLSTSQNSDDALSAEIGSQKEENLSSKSFVKNRFGILIKSKNKASGLNSSLLSTSQNSDDALSAKIVSQKKKNLSSGSFVKNRFGILIKSKNKAKFLSHQVRFFGNDNKQDPGSFSLEHSTSAADNNPKKSSNIQPDGKKRRMRCIVQWQPSLTSISENHCS